jgi:hypothetical protein
MNAGSGRKRVSPSALKDQVIGRALHPFQRLRPFWNSAQILYFDVILYGHFCKGRGHNGMTGKSLKKISKRLIITFLA